jgi:hypothetical protein
MFPSALPPYTVFVVLLHPLDVISDVLSHTTALVLFTFTCVRSTLFAALWEVKLPSPKLGMLRHVLAFNSEGHVAPIQRGRPETVLIGQPPLLQSLALSINEEIRSRVTYSVVLPRLSPEVIEQFILAQLDRAGLGHNTFTQEALALIVRSGEGLLRRTRNLCLSSLIEAVRDQTRVIDLKQVNRVLLQPHWRKDCDQPLGHL